MTIQIALPKYLVMIPIAAVMSCLKPLFHTHSLTVHWSWADKPPTISKDIMIYCTLIDVDGTPYENEIIVQEIQSLLPTRYRCSIVNTDGTDGPSKPAT